MATGYGQPPSTVYDWTLDPLGFDEAGFRLPLEAERRILVERFCNKVTKTLYSNRLDPVGLADDAQRSVLMTLLARELEELEQHLRGADVSCMCAKACYSDLSTLFCCLLIVVRRYCFDAHFSMFLFQKFQG